MLEVHFGDRNGYEHRFSVDRYFNNAFDMDLLLEEFSRNIIKEIDKSEVVNQFVIKSPFLGAMTPSELSTGVKSLLLLKYGCEGKTINICKMGENCYPFVMQLAMEQDLSLDMTLPVSPYLHGYRGSLGILNDGSVVSDWDSFIEKYLKFRGDWK